MKIKELIEELQKLDPDKSIYGYCEDEELKAEGKDVQLFSISKVSEVEAESSTHVLDSGKPCLKFGKSADSSKFILLEITSDV
jgi:hypothetical protein